MNCNCFYISLLTEIWQVFIPNDFGSSFISAVVFYGQEMIELSFWLKIGFSVSWALVEKRSFENFFDITSFVWSWESERLKLVALFKLRAVGEIWIDKLVSVANFCYFAFELFQKLVTYVNCGNFIIFVSLRFYVKSILRFLEVQNQPFYDIWRPWILIFI